MLANSSYNPDVLSCLANLSSDEVFTPPGLANEMLDLLPEELWSNKDAKFLDPVCKSGVFLREIAKRLLKGLEKEIPDLQKRIDHIFHNQIYGIAITELTGLLARRSVYCSKKADGEFSISEFKVEQGNIIFERTPHKWGDTKCAFCGSPKGILDRDEGLENYAYAFIHTESIEARMAELFGDNMRFDVVIGNPPYQMKGGAGGSSDSSIYQLFVEQAQKLKPKHLAMVIPSRWMSGGRGLDQFREEMLSSKKLSTLVDFPFSKEVFPNVEIKGGVCYFLWSDVHNGPCEVTVTRGDHKTTTIRRLDEYDVFIRDTRSVDILRKVLEAEEASITSILTPDTPFGIATNFEGFHKEQKSEDIALYYVRNGKRAIGYVPRKTVTKNASLIDKWKVLVPEAGSDGGQKIPDVVLGKPWICSPPAACTQSFLAFWVDHENEAKSLESYCRSKFFRHLVSLRKLTQHALRSTYLWVPMQKWNRIWTDEILYAKYGLSDNQIDYIESVIKPMNSDVADEI